MARPPGRLRPLALAAREVSSARRSWKPATVIVGFLLATAGCAGIGAHESRLHNAIADHRERAEFSGGLSGASGAVLVRHGLLEAAANDPGGTERALESELRRRPGSEPDTALAMAELSYQEGLALEVRSRASALPWYRDAAAQASRALAERGGSRPDLAERIHNGALARVIRIAQAEAKRDGRSWRQVLADNDIRLNAPGPYLDPARIADLRVASDLRVLGIDHVYRSGGLGVPLVAHRLADPSDSPDPADRLLPRELRTGATAVVLASGEGGDDAHQGPVTLALFDPFGPTSLSTGPRQLALADDRTTPLAAQVSRGHFATLEWMGLLEPSFQRQGSDTGLYALRPYERGKVPVVFVHGLVSSPRAWAQTINELRNSPRLAERYQFWVFLYPTGLPIPTSAARLREALVRARDEFDPGRTDAAFDQMVLVGHSMGGILSKMMVQDSGLELWDAAITVPHDRFKAPPELGKRIDEILIFRPVPFVRRTIFIATPHRGSPFANDLVGQVVSRLVRPPGEMDRHISEIEALNGPNVLSRELRGRRLNAIGNLRTDSPVLAALDHRPIDPSVPYHSIIPLIGDGLLGTDGVVEYRSSHLEGAASEAIVSGTHFSQGRPEVTRELRRILLEHVQAVNGDRSAALNGSARRTNARIDEQN